MSSHTENDRGDRMDAYFKLTISPDCISDLAAALIRVGVRRFKRPIWSFSPQTQDVCTSLGACAG